LNAGPPLPEDGRSEPRAGGELAAVAPWPAPRRRGVAAWTLLAMALLAARVALLGSPFLLLDDAFISFRYAGNLVAGQGLVFNPGERVEGYTNFLWTVLLAACHRAGLDMPAMSVVFALLAALGTIVLLALAIIVVRPNLEMPAVTKFIDGTGPVWAGSLFPFLFITIACGALSGFHSLISSGTTPKLLEKESQMRLIGYGGMLTESFVGIMALITAAILNQHLYFAMNAPAAQTGTTAQTAADYVNGLGLSGTPVTGAQITQAAESVGEKTIVSRTGGAPTLAFGMSQVLHQLFGGGALKAFWYHFAIMFEALFILTTVDAGTRVARFMLSDGLANLGGPLKKLRNPSWRVGAWICSVIVVAGWGSILLMGVTDPLGGINTLFPLFGIANQLLAAIALTVVTVVVIKRGLIKWAWIPAIPLFWDLTVTLTASWQKIFSADPKLGYWKQHSQYVAAKEAGKTAFGSAKTPDQIDAVIRNTFIQGTLSIVFAALVVIVFVTGLIVALRAVRGTGRPLTEDEPVPSRIFAPSGLIPTHVEREVQKQWDALPKSQAKSVGTSAN